MAQIILTPKVMANEFLAMLVAEVGFGIPDDGVLTDEDAVLGVTLKVSPGELQQPIDRFDDTLRPLVLDMAKTIRAVGKPLGRKLIIPPGVQDAASDTYKDVAIRAIPIWAADEPESVLYRFDTFVRRNV